MNFQCWLWHTIPWSQSACARSDGFWLRGLKSRRGETDATHVLCTCLLPVAMFRAAFATRLCFEGRNKERLTLGGLSWRSKQPHKPFTTCVTMFCNPNSFYMRSNMIRCLMWKVLCNQHSTTSVTSVYWMPSSDGSTLWCPMGWGGPSRRIHSSQCGP